MNWDQAYPPSWAKEMDKPGGNTSALLSWHSLGVLTWRHSKKQALYQSINQNQVAFFHSAIRSSVAFIQLHCSKKCSQKITGRMKYTKIRWTYLTISHLFRSGHKLWTLKYRQKIRHNKNRQKASFSNTVNVTRMSCLPTKRLRAHVGSISFLSDGLSRRKSPAQHHKAKKWNNQLIAFPIFGKDSHYINLLENSRPKDISPVTWFTVNLHVFRFKSDKWDSQTNFSCPRSDKKPFEWQALYQLTAVFLHRWGLEIIMGIGSALMYIFQTIIFWYLSGALSPLPGFQW